MTYQGYGSTLWVRVSDVWCARIGPCARFGRRPTLYRPLAFVLCRGLMLSEKVLSGSPWPCQNGRDRETERPNIPGSAHGRAVKASQASMGPRLLSLVNERIALRRNRRAARSASGVASSVSNVRIGRIQLNWSEVETRKSEKGSFRDIKPVRTRHRARTGARGGHTIVNSY